MLTDKIFLKLLKVTGVGYDNSLRVLLNPSYKEEKIIYRVYISEVGLTNSKVFFDVDPSYLGDQKFHIHGIQYVQVQKLLLFQTKSFCLIGF